MKHSPLGASKAHRWLECTMSPRVEALYPDEESEAAARGTAAHALAAKCLLENTDANSGDAERDQAVQAYLDFVRAEQERLKGSTRLVEHTFDLSNLYPNMFGTNDACILQPFGELVVVDYKNGVEFVDAVENPQLMYYGLGALQHPAAIGCDTVTLVIVQPNAFNGPPIRSWTVTPEHLTEWGRAVLVPKAQECYGPSAKYKRGPHCDYCRGKVECPEWQSLAVEVAGLPANPIETGEIPTLPDPQRLSPQQLALLLKWSSSLRDWCESAWGYAKARAEAGDPPEGFKLVAGRASRSWIEEGFVADRIPAELLYHRVMRSPAQVEAELKARKINLQIDDLIATTRGTTLAPVTDKRPAIQPGAGFTPLI